ncbi:hypothetical protein LP123_12005 [Moraxella bovis]|uniref:Uncharacterized protein n=1 Tax=Moraxella bovis TaxID=476 RepID=A0AAQ2SZ74_MORBO|nr:hypothetical protein [Moraxella bovis]AWY19473.1 hypothetical protein DQF64_02395 [Moraxella bovis]OOR87515.1 hypothetical protein B0182_12255 [Moraxella bovis]UYZ76187.1 hypothetical protein LP093_02350 [Moraxella bovis]UYZ77859.1 hypothetical protein LP115_11445 [Moraxella bovis]UYZ80754.1 hypothetical protein LP113_12125 [Moraxella bovis]
MKSLKAVLLCGLMAISGQSFAKPPTDIEIKFKKGDYCAIYQIDTRSDLHIYLNKNQKFTINLIAGIAKPYLTNSKGSGVEYDYSKVYSQKYDTNQSQWKYHIASKGKYTIGFDIPHDSHTYAELEFCAY